jgi:anti-anti-sigma regulatory factor
MVVRMTINAEWLEIDGERVLQGLQAARETLDTAQSDVVLNFSAVRRIDPNALRAMEKLAGLADGKAVKVVLRGVNVEIYKVLKLMRLTSRFSFVD